MNYILYIRYSMVQHLSLASFLQIRGSDPMSCCFYQQPTQCLRIDVDLKTLKRYKSCLRRWLLGKQASGKLGCSVASLMLCELSDSNALTIHMPKLSKDSSSHIGGRRTLLAVLVPSSKHIDVDQWHRMMKGHDSTARLLEALKGIQILLERTNLLEALGLQPLPSELDIEAKPAAGVAAAVPKERRAAAAKADTQSHVPLSSWASCCQGIDIFNAAGSGILQNRQNKEMGPPSAPRQLFVSTISLGVLQPSNCMLLSSYIDRTLAAGNSVMGMQTFFLSESSCKFLAQQTFHR